MSKIYMKRDDIRLVFPERQIEEIENYKEYQRLLLRAGYKAWVKDKADKVLTDYVPGTWIGIRHEGELVGTCAAEFGPVKGVRKPFSARIAALAVDKHCRGCGVGTDLVTWVILILKGLEYKHVYVAVQSDNVPAISIYRKVGFRQL